MRHFQCFRLLLQPKRNRWGDGAVEALDFAYLLSTTLEGPFRGAGFGSFLMMLKA
jgi:hypothetical protein